MFHYVLLNVPTFFMENYLMANLSHSETVCGKKLMAKDLMVKMWIPKSFPFSGFLSI